VNTSPYHQPSAVRARVTSWLRAWEKFTIAKGTLSKPAVKYAGKIAPKYLDRDEMRHAHRVVCRPRRGAL
jgi:hypothetical protein